MSASPAGSKLKSQFLGMLLNTSDDAVFKLLLNARTYVEHKKAKVSFPSVWLFACWLVHTKLDKTGSTFLDEFDISFEHMDLKTGPADATIEEMIFGPMKFSQLKDELKSLASEVILDRQELATVINFIDQRFQQLLTSICRATLGTPVERSADDLKKSRKRAKAGVRWVVQKVTFEKHRNDPSQMTFNIHALPAEDIPANANGSLEIVVPWSGY